MKVYYNRAMDSKNILISGSSGFVGKHLIELLSGQGHKVSGLGHTEQPENTDFNYFKCDLLNGDDLAKIPWDSYDAIIHLAGLAAVGPSFDKPLEYLDVNAGGTINICERLLGTKARVVAISSGAVYDNHQAMPLSESSSSLGYSSPYAVSKIAAENFCQYYKSRGLDVVIARPFNHIGPGQGLGFILPDLYKQVAERDENGSKISVGDLTTKRDYTDVRDIVEAYQLLADTRSLPNPVYNICSGQSHSGQEILNTILEVMGIEPASLEIVVDQTKIRPNDPKDVVGSNGRLTEDTGWRPRIELKKTVSDFIDFASRA